MLANQYSSEIRLLEALYDVEQPRTVWFRGVLKAAASALDRGAGVGMVLYDVSRDVPRVEAIDGVNLESNGTAVGAAIHAQPEFAKDIVQSYRTDTCATLDEHVRNPVQNSSMREVYAPLGLMDQVLINGVNDSGIGAALCVFSKVRLLLTPLERLVMARISSHLASAYRLQRRLESVGTAEIGVADAVLRVDGRLEHAGPSANSCDVRSSLSSAVLQRECARARSGRRIPERATEAWNPLVGGRWSLVDHYERNGSRFIIARENASRPTGSGALSSRERQVASLACLGHSNKVIAYELGLAHSTVRVLLGRAAAKLGARSRAELVEKLHVVNGNGENSPAPG